jgi:threonine-phosphate decarboxylase
MTPSEKYEFMATQHGGYYRHNFIDHAYLYNLYFPPEEIFTNFKNQIHDLVSNYPVAQTVLAELVGNIIDQPSRRIVVGNGASELIKIVSGNPETRLIIPVPSFNEYANAVSTGHITEFPLEFPSFKLDVDKFAEHSKKVRANIAVVVTPNNPTSLIIPTSDLIYLAKKLEAIDCMLIVDESFLDFSNNSEAISLEQDIEAYPNLAIFKSMSKVYGICGIRIGYMLTANLNFAKLVRQGIHIWNINGFAEEFLRLLPNYKTAFIESCNKVKEDRDIFYERLCEIEGLTVYKPDANFIFCRLPENSPSGPVVSKKLFVEYNIYIKDCAGKSMPDAERYLRIASRTQEENSNFTKALISILTGSKTKEKTVHS